MKDTIKISPTDKKKLAVGMALVGGFTVKQEKTIAGVLMVEVNGRSASNFFELGAYFAKVTGTELDEPVKEAVKEGAKK